MEDPGKDFGAPEDRDGREQAFVPDAERRRQEPVGKRPLGISVIAVYLGLSGILGLIAGITMVSSPQMVIDYASQSPEIKPLLEGLASGDVSTFGITVIMISAVNLALVWGLLKFAYWARIALLGISSINVISSLLSGLGLFSVAQMLAPALIVIYLVQPKVARLFLPMRTRELYRCADGAQSAGSAVGASTEKMEIKCPRCGNGFHVTKDPYGATPIKCPNCGKEGIIP